MLTQTLPLLHAPIERLIPHSGAMCLLDSVQSFDESHIECIAISHRDPHNPLRDDDALGSATGVEYAAQAMAVHGALLAQQSEATPSKPRPGMIASLRAVRLHVRTLHDVSDDLHITATRLMGDDNNILYEFTVKANMNILLEGRATVVLAAAALSS